MPTTNPPSGSPDGNAPRFEPGTRLDGWTLERFLGAGAFGETWRAVDPDGVPAAVKLMTQAPGDELRALASIVHPSVVGVLDAGGGAQPWLAMEYAPGRTLEGLEVDDAPALQIAGALFDALAAVHEVVSAHGDVKPENVIVALDAQPVSVKLIDFGLVGGTQGGTLAWAAPERLTGGGSSAEADVYAAGMILWTLLHGQPPFGELPPGEALLRRRSTMPEPTRGPAWVQDLLREVLSLDPGRRPSASAAADALAAHGVPLPTIDGPLLRRRARSVRVERSDISTIRSWCKSGGSIAVVGGPGSGRSHLLQRAAVELSADGVPFTRLQGDGTAWGAIAAALEDPRLPGSPVEMPAVSDAADRAYAATRRLLRRANGPLRVLVDDVEQLDAGSRQVLEVLALDRQCHVLLTATEAPEFVDEVVALGPWDLAGITDLVTQLLGADPADVQSLVRYAAEVSGGVPRIVVDAVVGAVDRGAVVNRARRWIEDTDRLSTLPPPTVARAVSLDGLSDGARRVGAMLACIMVPCRVPELASHLDRPPEEVAVDVEGLVLAGLVRREGDLVRVASLVGAQTLLDAYGDVRSLHATIVSRMGTHPPTARLGWHLVRAGDAACADQVGEACVRDALRHDAAEAAHLADAMWELAPVDAIASVRLVALVQGGRADDAVEFGEALRRQTVTPSVGVWTGLARAYQAREDFERALEVARMARDQVGEAPLSLREVEAQALFRLGQHEAAHRMAQQATLCDHPPAGPMLDSWLRLKGVEAQSLYELGEMDHAIDLIRGLDAEIGSGTTTRGLLQAMLGRLLWHARRYREAADVMAGVAKLSGGLGSLDRARLANNAALANYQIGDLAGAVAQWERSRLLFERLGVVQSEIAVQLNLSIGYLELGRWERARRAGTWALEHARAQQDVHHVAMAAGNLGDVLCVLGEYDAAEDLYAHSVELAREHKMTSEEAEGLRRLAQLAVERGDPNAAERCDRAERFGRDTEALSDAALAAALRGVCHAREKESSAATAALARSRALLSDAGGARDLAEWRLCSAMVNEALGRTERAVAELARVVLYADEVGNVHLRNRSDVVAQRIESGTLAKGSDREAMILDLSVRVARERDLDSLLKTVVDGALALTDADRAFVLRRNPELVAARAFRLGAEQAAPSWSIAHRAMDEGRDVIVADLGDRPDLRVSTSVMVLDLRSVMCVPLVCAGEVLGALYVDSRHAGEQELLEVGRYLRALAAYAAIAITNADRVVEHDRRIEDAAGLAHDMRNLALVLIGFAEDLVETMPETESSVAHVAQVGHQLVRMTEGFLRPDRVERKPVQVSDLVHRLCALVRREAERRKVDLVVSAVPEVYVLAEADQLRRALFNLIHNAFKYSDAGGEVEVTVESLDETVLITVHDSGPGIPDDLAPRLFDFRMQGREAREGYGIGLSVAGRTIMDLGGRIDASNHPDGGALVTIELPIMP